MKKLELIRLIREEIQRVSEDFGLPFSTYNEFSTKQSNLARKSWAYFADLYEKDIHKAKSERELKQRERDILPKLQRKELQDAYRVFLLYQRDKLRGKQLENVTEIISRCREESKQLSEGVFWPTSKLSTSFETLLNSELKKMKGMYYVDGYDLYSISSAGDKKIMTINPQKDSLNSIMKKLKTMK